MTGKQHCLEIDAAWLQNHPQFREEFSKMGLSMLDLRAMVKEQCLPLGCVWVRRDGVRFRVEKHRIVEMP